MARRSAHPTLHYVFTGPGNVSSGVDDYYLCRTEEPDEDIGDCSYSGSGVVVNRTGNRDLKAETGRTFTAGFVFSPSPRFQLSVDYFQVTLNNQVDDLSIDQVAEDEADCRIGTTANGAPVNVTSPTCIDAIARVNRFASGGLAGQISSIRVNPINIAREKTNGLDIAFRGSLPTSFGTFTLSLNHSHVFNHKFQQYPGDPVIEKLAVDSGYYIPRDKSSASLNWENDWLALTDLGNPSRKTPEL